jgi:lysophospholipase L1-like esterase
MSGAATGGRSGAGGRAGAGGNGGGSGTGGSSGFNPCPATGACKILPLGDSITDGIGFSGGYRVSLFSRALADNKTITFVGGSMNGPTMVSGQPFPRAHEGHSGWTIAQIDGIVPDPALGPTPHIVLLHIGTNDMASMGSGAPNRLGALIDQIVADLPDALLVVAKIIPFPGASSQVNTFNNAVPGVVEQRASAGKHVILVDQFTGFPTNELGDGVHPNQAGYTRMAGVWYAAISSYLR